MLFSIRSVAWFGQMHAFGTRPLSRCPSTAIAPMPTLAGNLRRPVWSSTHSLDERLRKFVSCHWMAEHNTYAISNKWNRSKCGNRNKKINWYWWCICRLYKYNSMGSFSSTHTCGGGGCRVSACMWRLYSVNETERERENDKWLSLSLALYIPAGNALILSALLVAAKIQIHLFVWQSFGAWCAQPSNTFDYFYRD